MIDLKTLKQLLKQRSIRRRIVWFGLAIVTWISILSSTAIALDKYSFLYSSNVQPSLRSNAAESVINRIDENLLEQGQQLYLSGQYTAAIALWQQALPTADQPQQARLYNYLALAYQKLGDWQSAEQALSQSFDRLTDSSHAQLRAQIYNTQGHLHLNQGQPEAALASWQQAETDYQAAADQMGQLGSRINQAQALQRLGLYHRAQSLLEAINTDLQSLPNSALKALGLRSLGTVLQVTGRLKESQQILQQSLTLAQQLNLQPELSETQFSLGNTLRGLQSHEAALALYQQAAATAPTELGRLRIQLNQLNLLIETQQIEAAEALAAQLQPKISQLSPGRDAIYLQVNLATQLMQIASNDRALAIAQLLMTAAQQANTLQDRRAESDAIGQLAHLYEQSQQWEIAQSLSEQALLLAQAAQAEDIAYRWQWQLGRILKRQDNPAAIATYREALKTLELIRRDLLATHPDFQVSFRKDVEPVYRELVDLLIQPGASEQDLQEARQAIESLRLAELENFFRSACLDTAQQIDAIDATAAIFYPILLEQRLVVIVSLPGQPLRYHMIPVPLTEVETVAAAFRRNLILPYTSDREIQSLGQQLYTWLVQPVAETLAANQIETLVFVQDGVLQTIPMAALYDGERYLVETYHVALTPGLSLFEPNPLNQVPLKAVTAGLTESRHSFESLEFVETELTQIQSEIPSDVLLDRNFTSTTLANKLEGTLPPIVHIATHGQFSSEAEQTFILAWDQPITVDRFSSLLQTSERAANSLELLVLSACETAVGDNRAALGLAGVAVESGARSTLASLWLIDDESTPLMMTQFYRSLKAGSSKAAALRQAQLTLLQGEYSHPRFWAAFVLLGNWR